MTTLQALLGIALPIVQAPMAGVQGSALAIAVSNAGGLGSLPCAMLSSDALRSELQLIRSHTRLPYNLNFFCHTPAAADSVRDAAWHAALRPYYEQFGLDMAAQPAGPSRAPFSAAVADLLEEFRPPVVSFHFGLPDAALMTRIKSWGSKVLSTATTVDEARWLEAHGADAIIAQGLEAGGHRGMFRTDDLTTQSGTFTLLPHIVQAVALPVIAAGGIADAARHTALTNLFSGRPARGIVNRIIRELGPMGSVVPGFPLATAAIAPLRAHAEKLGSGDFSPLWAGQNVSGCREVSAQELTLGLAENAALMQFKRR